MRELPKNVVEGAKLLDEVMPGWAEKINLDTLNMDLRARCILGQLFGNYSVGLQTLKIKNWQKISSSEDGAYGSGIPKMYWEEEIKKRLKPKVETMTTRKFPKTIEEGAKLLDAAMPGWADKIKVDNLVMNISDSCILGQLYGSYKSGVQKLNLRLDVHRHVKANRDIIFGSTASVLEWEKEIEKRVKPKVVDEPVVEYGVYLNKQEINLLFGLLNAKHPNLSEHTELKSKLLTLYSK